MELYSHLMFCASILLMYFGHYCIYGSVPQKKTYQHYREARILMGTGFLAFSLMFMLHYVFDFREWNSKAASTLNLTIYYLAAVLFGKSFYIMLEPKKSQVKGMDKGFWKWLAFAGVLWTPFLLSASDRVKFWVLFISTLYFFMDGIRMILRFTNSYRQVIRKMDDYYTDETAIFIQWISKSAYTLSIFALFVGATNFLPKWCINIYVVGSILTFMYMFNGIMNYLIHYTDVQDAVSENRTDEKDIIEAPVKICEEPIKPADIQVEERELTGNQEELLNQLEEWIRQKKYLQKELTIEQVAMDVKSNRTYVSSFINQHYRNTFREWIAQLRIAEAIRLLEEDPELKATELADLVGYSTQRTFQKFFLQYAKSSLKEWKKHSHP